MLETAARKQNAVTKNAERRMTTGDVKIEGELFDVSCFEVGT